MTYEFTNHQLTARRPFFSFPPIFPPFLILFFLYRTPNHFPIPHALRSITTFSREWCSINFPKKLCFSIRCLEGNKMEKKAWYSEILDPMGVIRCRFQGWMRCYFNQWGIFREVRVFCQERLQNSSFFWSAAPSASRLGHTSNEPPAQLPNNAA